ncbi:hypothetical protein GCM10022271_15830 [Corallibacter vietnamensis]|uniref:asparagine synthase (glutamine-hydrolyzing) n=1 Tax=Corallibacter vietnamensis TaxID=904130 RepID=A0ABP7H4Q3_9FLAO
MKISTPIIPSKQIFANVANKENAYNLEAICVFVATGFFMGADTYWKNKVCLLPAHDHELDAQGRLLKSTPNFNWYYQPEQKPFKDTLSNYIELLTTITKNQVKDNPVILPLSGGLDSRSQALVLKNFKNEVQAFSYAFQGGYPEHHIAKKIAKECRFSFKQFDITPGYLWQVIDDLLSINGGYSEFTHPRQMAVLPELKKMTGVFSLGHWGDVLFDRGVPEATQKGDVVPLLLKKMVKPRGLILAEKLWSNWGLKGDFKTYLIDRITTDLNAININNISAKVRAYKTSQWAHRWTTTNLSVFEAANPMTLPYYDNRMCEFVCKTPESYLADRRLQIAHINQDKALANITWQAQKPFSVANYAYNKTPYNIPYRIVNKLQRTIKNVQGKPYIQRNWELQFLGDSNAEKLESYLFDNNFNTWIPKDVVKSTYNTFLKEDPINTAHAVSMLLTLAVWYKKNNT